MVTGVLDKLFETLAAALELLLSLPLLVSSSLVSSSHVVNPVVRPSELDSELVSSLLMFSSLSLSMSSSFTAGNLDSAETLLSFEFGEAAGCVEESVSSSAERAGRLAWFEARIKPGDCKFSMAGGIAGMGAG